MIRYTTDGTTPTLASPTYNNQRARSIGEVLTLATPGAYTVKWFATDIKGNQSAVKTQRLLVAADDADGTVGGTVPPTLSLSLGTRGGVPAVHAGRRSDVQRVDDGQRDLVGRRRRPVGRRPELDQHGQARQRHVHARPAAPGLGDERRRHRRRRSRRSVARPTRRSVLTYAGPTSNDQVTVNFRQTIGRTEALRTGAYSKTLTFTLSTTQP